MSQIAEIRNTLGLNHQEFADMIGEKTDTLMYAESAETPAVHIVCKANFCLQIKATIFFLQLLNQLLDVDSKKELILETINKADKPPIFHNQLEILLKWASTPDESDTA